MKVKSTLWALAFACMAVSCSDDFEDPNKGGDDNGLQGQSAYMKVTVNSEITTRANPTGGEEGDDDEVGSEDEYTVKDVTVILYEASGQTGDGYNFVGQTNDIIAAGWAQNTGMTTGSFEKHDWTATVKLSFTDQAQEWNGKTFGIIAVTNLGQDNGLLTEIAKGETSNIKNGEQLANYLQNKYKTDNGFVMSTHTTNWNGIATTIKLDANANADNAPKADVFVERLAAKVRINEGVTSTATSGNRHLGNFVYASGTNSTDRVVLEHALVVNQLTSGSYLLKRVTEENANVDGDIKYLGDELPATGGEATNYVIDPWTTSKTKEHVADYSKIKYGETVLSYDNPFKGNSYNALWIQYTVTAPTEYDQVQLNNNTARTSPLLLCYTMENTTSADNSLNGYSTGALFRAIYYPAQWTAVDEDDDSTEPVDVEYASGQDKGIAGDMVTSDVTTLPQGKDFYVYNQKIYQNYDAILAEFLNAVLEDTKKDNDLTISDFSEDKIKSLTVKNFKASKASGVTDEFGYITYLGERAKELEEQNESNFTETDSFEAFCATEECKKDNVRKYTNGVCYYPYWIRHANNGKPADMGVMEFGIVRNNIYDLTVSQISQLGLSGSDVPAPEDPDEDGDARMVVNIHVKNWVVRNNGGIIL